MFFDQLPLSTGEGQQSGNNPPETKTMTLTLNENEMTVLYFALNTALIAKDRNVEELSSIQKVKGIDLRFEIDEAKKERDTIRTIQLQIPAEAIKI
jgi:hypothetical protein